MDYTFRISKVSALRQVTTCQYSLITSLPFHDSTITFTVCLILKANLYLCCFITDVPKPIRYQLFCTFFTFKFFISLISALGMLLCSLLFLCYYNCILLFQYALDFKNILYMVGLTWKIFVLYEVIQVSELLLPGFCCSGNIVTANGSL